jgi:N-acetylglutamate synthase-like GNAT family acetyltransferase
VSELTRLKIHSTALIEKKNGEYERRLFTLNQPFLHVTRGEYTISTDPQRLDMDVIYAFLHNDSYWRKGVARSIVEKSVRNSLCFGVYHHESQVGFCRVVTDYATFGWLADVFILPAYRGRGLSKWLVETVVSHPDLQGLRRMILATRDAHGLYAKYGFKVVDNSDRYMERVR